MSKALRGLGTGAATGAGIGGAVGSVVPVIGTAIGTGVGAVAGGVIGLFSGMDEERADERDAKRLRQDQASMQQMARKEAFDSYLMNEAAARGANPALMRYTAYQKGVKQIERQAHDNAAQLEANIQANNQTTAGDLLPLVQAGAQVGQAVYKGYNTPDSEPLNAAQFEALGTNQGKPLVTPQAAAQRDLGVSPEVSVYDPESLRPLRTGKRVGWGQM